MPVAMASDRRPCLTVSPRAERSIRIVSADGKHTAIVNTLPNYDFPSGIHRAQQNPGAWLACSFEDD